MSEKEFRPNPFKGLVMSRKFWVMVFDVLVSSLVYFITKYASPETAKDVLFLIGAWQPVILMVIGSIAYEDGKTLDAVTANEAQEDELEG